MVKLKKRKKLFFDNSIFLIFSKHLLTPRLPIMKLTGHQLILEVQRSISAKDLSQNYENQNYENLDQTELAEIARTNNTISTSNASQSNQNLDQTQIGISVNGSRGDTMTTNDGEGSSSVTVATTVKMKESQGSQISRGSRK